MAAGRRTSITLTEDAACILEGQDNVSDYICRLVERRQAEWRSAFMRLRQAGWLQSELLAACDALNGVWMMDTPPQWDAQELHDAHVAGKWDIPSDVWAARCRQIAADGELAHALRTLAVEFWAGNSELERRLQG